MVLNVFSFSIEEYEKLFLKICGNPQLQASNFFWLQHLKVFDTGSEMIWSVGNKKSLYYLRNSLSPQTMSVEPEPKFQAPVPPSEIYLVPAPQPW